MTRIGIALAFVGGAVLATSASAPPALDLDELLDRMGTYLREYETQLSSVLADESMEQRVRYLSGYTRRSATQRLDSEVFFMRLPGGAEWLGFRDVQRINGRRLLERGPRIQEVLNGNADPLAQAKAIADASAKFNFGLPRTINMPTVPLDIIHPRHRQAHRYELIGREKLRGWQTAIIGFHETGTPTLVKEPTGEDLRSSGRVWVDETTGTVARVQWVYRSERHGINDQAPGLKVDFATNRDLNIMVPAAMEETFDVLYARGEGSATYKNFRRFGTSARIVPQ